MIGERVSHYRITGRLGAGGMGVVYEAQDLALGRRVAIKVLPPDLEVDRQALLRFQLEARAASALNHPHICIVHELGDHEGRPFIVMERLEGGTLKHLLRSGPLAGAVLLDLAWQIADALDAAHGAGIVHRDLKPDNIFVTNAQVVKLLDFGVAKLMTGHAVAVPEHGANTETVEDPITEAGRTFGTPHYMSPEQARNDEVDARTDLFSLGAVLYEMATGRRARGAPPGVAAVLPPGLAAVVGRALEQEPGLRYQTAADLKADLARLKKQPSAGPSYAAKKAPRWVWPVAAALTIALAGVAVWRSPVKHGSAALQGSRFGSLAVLPLDNLSRDPEQQYFAAGMTDALINDLSGIASLRVTSATSSRHAREGPPRRVQEIARLLDVDAIIEGAVARAGDHVRISARLIDTRADRTIWSGTYERHSRDVLALQREIAAAIAAEIGGLAAARVSQPRRARPAASPEAYDLYLKGRYFWNLYTEEGWNKAIDYFQRALRVDAQYAPAWSGLADSYYQLSNTVLPPDQAIPDARAAAARALDLDDALAEAHASLGVIKAQYDWDRSGARRELSRAVALNPNYATAHQWLGMYYFSDARFEDALAELEAARRLDPLSFYIAATATWPLPHLGRYEEAIGRLEEVAQMHPEFADLSGIAHELRGELWLLKRKPEAALPEFLQGATVRNVSGDSPAAVGALRVAFARGGMQAYWRKQLDLALREYEMRVAAANRQTPPRYVSALPLARLYARLGQRDQAFRILDRCLRSRDENLLWMKAESLRPDSPWTSIRDDPRFAALLRRVGLEASDTPSGSASATLSSSKQP
jgi:serine/threonine protein kinase/tetratricopeptide (TPR) repeat protein